jgi:diaminopimelate epimerase
MKIEFTKMSGAGNDFIVLGPEYVDLLADAANLARRLCRRRTDIGADGLIIVERTGGRIAMHYYNGDGSVAAFCGNGARCVVLFCQLKGLADGRFHFASQHGLHTGQVNEKGVTIGIEGASLRGETMISAGNTTYQISVVDAGVPHAIILSKGIADIDVGGVGRTLWNHPYFGGTGANVNFVDISGKGVFGIRTYERGVGRETLACGSGCVAAAHLLRSKNLAGQEVSFRVASGDVLTVGLPSGNDQKEAYLTGPASVVYEGTVEIKE